MSPEQAAGDGEIDARTDIYALGCVLYEMLTGEPPHRAPTVQAMLGRRFTEPPPLVRRVRENVPAAVPRRALTQPRPGARDSALQLTGIPAYV